MRANKEHSLTAPQGRDSELVGAGLQQLRVKTHETLVAFDRSMKKLHADHTPVADIWTEVCAFSDTNELLRMNLMQIQTLFQEAYQSFFSERARNAEKLNKILDALITDPTIADYEEFRRQKTNFEEDERKARKELQDFAKTMRQLFTEYRQAEMAKKYLFHLNEVQSFMLLCQAAIHQQVHDQNTLVNLSRSLREGYRKMFSQSIDIEPEDEEA